MHPPSILRLNLLRAGYLLLVVGLGLTIWPQILNGSQAFSLMRGVVICMLGAMSALALLGLRYPLRLLPLLFFEMGWKALWLARIALPLWLTHRLDAGITQTALECAIALVYPVIIPWSYVRRTYFTAPPDPWRIT